MSSSDRERREAEKAARRARRLAERAEQRAQRKAEQAHRASQRAQDLADRAATRTSPRHRDAERSIEDVVDDVADQWSRKAEAWIDQQTHKLFDDADGAGASYADLDDDPYGTGGEARRARKAAEDAKRAAERAEAFARESSERNMYREDASRRRRTRSSGRYSQGGESSTGRRDGTRSQWQRSWKRRNRNGNLYRSIQHKKVCGVCAGLADYWGVERWHVRVGAVLGLFFLPSLMVPAYFIAYFLMDKKPYYRRVTDRFEELDGVEPSARKRRAKRQGSAPGAQDIHARPSNTQALRSARTKFAGNENRLRLMESYVTSPRFELQRELKKIAGED